MAQKPFASLNSSCSYASRHPQSPTEHYPTAVKGLARIPVPATPASQMGNSAGLRLLRPSRPTEYFMRLFPNSQFSFLLSHYCYYSPHTLSLAPPAPSANHRWEIPLTILNYHLLVHLNSGPKQMPSATSP